MGSGNQRSKMAHMNVVVHPTADGMMTFQLIVPRRRPKLATNRSHYLMADERRNLSMEIDGVKRNVVAMVKIWSPLKKSEKNDTASELIVDRIRRRSPMLL